MRLVQLVEMQTSSQISAYMAQKFLRENLPEKLTTPQEAIRRPSKAAESAGKSLGRMVGRMLKSDDVSIIFLPMSNFSL